MATSFDVKSFDPYELKEFLIDLAETYFKTNKLDTYEAGFLGYLIQSLSYLTSDTLFMNGMAYNEAFTTKAILDTSLLNLASMFDYQYDAPIPASGLMTLRVPLDSIPSTGFTFTIPILSRATAENIPFRVSSEYKVIVNNLSDIVIYRYDENSILSRHPFSVVNDGGVYYLEFDVDVHQADYLQYTFSFPKTKLYQFYKEYINSLNGSVFKIKVFVNDEPYQVISNIYTASSLDKVVQFRTTDNGVEITFGNSSFGYLPDDGDECRIIMGVTLGSKGNVTANSVSLIERIYDSEGRVVTNIQSFNRLPILNGRDIETKDEMRRNIINHISSLDRLVTQKDYFNMNSIVPYFRNTISKTYLLRRDIHINEVATFMVFFDEENEAIPTTCTTQEIPDTETVRGKDYIYNIDGEDYVCPFRMLLDDTSKIKTANYEYIVTDLKSNPEVVQSYRTEMIGLNYLRFVYIGSDSIAIEAYGTCDSSLDPLDISGEIVISGGNYSLFIDPASTPDNVKLSTNAIPLSSISPGELSYDFYIKWQSNNHTLFRGLVIIKQRLDDLVWSNYILDGSNKKVYNIPVILKSYYDDNKEIIDDIILSKVAQYKTHAHKYHMMTDVINLKFAKTYGKSYNMEFNQYNDDALYTYPSGFSIDIPLKISVNVVLKSDSSRSFEDVRDEVRNVLYTFLHVRSDFHMDIFRSDLERYVHDTIQDVAYVEIVDPSQEIVYSFDLDMVPKTERDKVLSFVPEFLWIRKDDISVNVTKLSM